MKRICRRINTTDPILGATFSDAPTQMDTAAEEIKIPNIRTKESGPLNPAWERSAPSKVEGSL